MGVELELSSAPFLRGEEIMSRLACGLTREYLELIMIKPMKDSDFLEDNSDNDNVKEILEQLKEKYEYDDTTRKNLGLIYVKFKKICKVSDEKIAELFHITRYQLRQILKNNRIK